MTAKDLNIEKTFQGAWRITAMVDNNYFSMQYFFCSKTEAIEDFMQDAKAYQSQFITEQR